MDHSDKSPSIPLFQRGKWMPIPLGCVYRHSLPREGEQGGEFAEHGARKHLSCPRKRGIQVAREWIPASAEMSNGLDPSVFVQS